MPTKMTLDQAAKAVEKRAEALRQKDYELTTEEREVKEMAGVDPEEGLSRDGIDRLFADVDEIKKYIAAEKEAEKEEAESGIPTESEPDPREGYKYPEGLEGLGLYARDVRDMMVHNNYSERMKALKAIEKTTGYLEEGQESMGGALVPEEVLPQLLALPAPTAVMRPIAWTIQTNRKTVSVPAIIETSRSSTTHGGVVGYWTAEGGSITESNPAFGQKTLSAKKLAMYTHVTNELLNDAVGLGDIIQRIFTESMAFFEDKGFIKGSGVNEPLGLTNAGCKDNINTTASHFYVEDAATMFGNLLPGSFTRAVWLMSQSVLPELFTMESLGNSENLWWKGAITVHDAPPNWRLFGRPIYFTEFCAALGTSTDIMLIDPTYYMLLSRQAVSFEASQHAEFQNDRTVYRLTLRTDGQCWMNSTLTLADGSTTVSAVVNSHHA